VAYPPFHERRREKKDASDFLSGRMRRSAKPLRLFFGRLHRLRKMNKGRKNGGHDDYTIPLLREWKLKKKAKSPSSLILPEGRRREKGRERKRF